MKKILAVVIVAVLALALCLGASAIHNEEDTTSVWFNNDEFKYSWDTIYINGQSHMDLGWGADGAAAVKLAEHQPLSGADIDTFTIRGWAGLIDGTVAEWGYKVNEGTPVFNADFTKPTEDAVIGAGGDSRFEIVVPVNKATAPTLITACAKDENGTVYDFIEFSLNGQYTGAPASGGDDTPATAAKILKVDLQAEATSGGVEAEVVDGKLVCTTGETNDPWVSIPVEVDTSVYKFFTVTYKCDKEIGSNNTYLKTTGYIGAGDGGDWEPHGMNGTADGELHSVTYNIAEGFPTFVDQTITGIRLTCCAEEGGVFTVESIVFSDVENPGEQQGGEQPGTNPGTADASVIAIAAVACIALAGVVVAKKVR